MKRILILTASVIYVSLCFELPSLFYSKGVHIDRLEMCNKSINVPISWDEISVIQGTNGVSSVYSRGTVLRDLSNLNITVDLERCASEEALDTCQRYTTIKPLDTCQLLALTDMAWSGIVHAFEPPIRCPIKKGVYISRNATLDPNIMFFFPMENWYWKMIIKVNVEGEYMHVCMNIRAVYLTRLDPKKKNII